MLDICATIFALAGFASSWGCGPEINNATIKQWPIQFRSDNLTENEIGPAEISKNARVTIQNDITIIAPEIIRDKLLKSLEFLDQEFGAALYGTDVLEIEIVRDSTGVTPHTTFEGEEMHIKMDILALIDGEEHILVHELFHALYQDNFFLSQNLMTVEGWAAYAELRYQFQSESNEKIRHRIMKEYQINEAKCRYFNDSDGDWHSLVVADMQGAYMMSSCILLNETEKEIRNRFDIYRRALTHSLSRKDRREICQEKKGNDVGVNVHVALLQSCLNTLGMYSGSIDGLKGRQTAAALRRFEHLFGIPLGNLDLQSSIEYIVMFIALNRVQARG